MAKIVPISSVVKFADALARSLRANLKWSTQLRKAVTVSKAVDSGGTVSITVAVGEGKKDKSGMPLSGMARAYEYGSGLHATRAIARRYRIDPRLKPTLAFSSTQGGKGHRGGIIVRPFVMHPGVNARPYMAKSVQAIRARATAELALDIRKNLVQAMNVTIREINQK